MILSSKTFYTLFAGSYTNYSLDKREYLSTVNRFVKDESVLPRSMVDVGSGNGKRGKHIAETLGLDKFTIIDNSEGMIALSKQISGAESVLVDISSPDFVLKQSYDLILFLWNVLGHIPADRRKTTLFNLARLASDKGVIFIDVNNRYNISHYGLKAVSRNLLKDILKPDKNNGDFKLKVKTAKGDIETVVHIFSPFEMEKLIKSAGLKILKRSFVNYTTGKISRTFLGGQLVYKLKKI